MLIFVLFFCRDVGGSVPFRCDVLERVSGGYGEGDEDDVSLAVGQWSQALVVFLACRIP